MRRMGFILATAACFVAIPNIAKSEYHYVSVRAFGSKATYLSGINNFGTAVGNYQVDPSHVAGFVREADGTIENYNLPGVTNPLPSNINDAGQVVGYSNTGGAFLSFLADPDGSYQTIHVEGAELTRGYDLNEAGQVAGVYRNDDGIQHGFLRDTDGSFALFDVAGARGTVAYGINDLGQIVGSYNDSLSVTHGFFRDADGTITSFDFPIPDPSQNLSTLALGLNNLGQIVGYSNSRSLGMVGFIRDSDGSYETISVVEPGDAIVTDINDQSTIVGYYFGPKVVRGFVGSPGAGPPVSLVPEPSSLLLSALGIGCGAARFARRGRRLPGT